jgi:pimeloyl-ACP methyl ester carboxylesterase
VLIVVHGGPGVTHEYLRPELDRYNTWGEVVYYDQRGCGASGGVERYGWEDHVADLHRIVEHVRKGRAVVLVGSSFGSTLIAQYLGQHASEVAGVIISGLDDAGSESPAEVRDRLTACDSARRATGEGFADATWRGDELFMVPRLIFTDSGPNGRQDAAPRRAARGDGISMALPSHDPWYTHRDEYFRAVAEFMLLIAP